MSFTQLDDELAAHEEAERRLLERSSARLAARERRERRRAAVQRWLGDATRVPGLALVGAAALVALLEASGGDLRGWPRGTALLVLALVLTVPAALAAWFARRRGRTFAASIGLATLGLQLALTFGIAFLALGAGPE